MPDEMTRRVFLGVAGAAASVVVGGAPRAVAGMPPRRIHATELGGLSAFERLHFPAVRLPVVTQNGDRVPIVVEMSHPMEAAHHVAAVAVVNARDPVPSKGVFRLAPRGGQAYIAFQARLDEGSSEVAVTAECNRHGAFTTVQSVTVADGRGGCAAAAPVRVRTDATGILPPRIRIPRLIAGGRVRSEEVVDVQVSMRHPNRTGLALRNRRFVQESAPFHLHTLDALLEEEPIGHFALTAALSDDPLITFRMRAGRGGRLRVVLINSREERFEAVTSLDVG